MLVPRGTSETLFIRKIHVAHEYISSAIISTESNVHGKIGNQEEQLATAEAKCQRLAEENSLGHIHEIHMESKLNLSTYKKQDQRLVKRFLKMHQQKDGLFYYWNHEIVAGYYF